MPDLLGDYCWHCVWVEFGADPELNDFALSPPNPGTIYRAMTSCQGCGASTFTGQGRAVREEASL